MSSVRGLSVKLLKRAEDVNIAAAGPVYTRAVGEGAIDGGAIGRNVAVAGILNVKEIRTRTLI